ncbi:MAG: hypothetical protein AAFQ80_18575 [Cyanobacteria bacterium J06621_8]
MESKQINHKLCWYEKYGDDFRGKCNLEGITLSELQTLFDQPSEDPMIYCYPVLSHHTTDLQKFVRHKIKLNLFDYFIESQIQ